MIRGDVRATCGEVPATGGDVPAIDFRFQISDFSGGGVSVSPKILDFGFQISDFGLWKIYVASRRHPRQSQDFE
jgi:hypothetical protein